MYCNGNPAGVLLGNLKSDHIVDIMVDYSIPMYRDCSVGKYLYSKLPSKGIHTLEYRQEDTEEHVAYMKKMGFTQSGDAFICKLK